MNVQEMLKALQDPMGVPFYPVVFQILMVLTFAIHIIFVNLTIGTLFLSIYGYIKNTDFWKNLSASLVKATTVSISMAMLFGIAPLLFIQVLYDPFWYTSNVLSATWVIAFILILMIAYSFTYVFYLRMKKGNALFFGIVALVLFFLAGIIMHALNYQLLHPENWLSWYTEGERIIPSGTKLHAFQLPRFLHFIIPSFAITGVFLMLYQWYFAGTGNKDEVYLAWAGKTGARMAFIFSLIQAIAGVWWLLVLPGEFNFILHPLFLLALIMGILLLFVLYFARKNPLKFALPSFFTGFLTVLFMSLAREALRMNYLQRSGYSIYEYKLNIDWGSTLLFFLTFLMGLVVITYLLSVAYRSGRTSGTYTAPEVMHRWGKLVIGLLILWLLVMVGLGAIITAKNYL